MKSKKTKNGARKISAHDFGSVEQMLSAIESATAPRRPGGAYEEDRRSNPWRGTATFEEAARLAAHGWPEGLERIAKARALIKLPIAPEAYQITPAFADEGDEVAVDRFLEGEADHWLSFPVRQTTARGRIARIRANIGASSSFSADQLMTRGAFIAALVDAMETAGIRCEVVACMQVESSDGHAGHRITVTLKRAEDPAEMDRLAFWLVNPSAMRRFFIRLIEMSPHYSTHIGDTCGAPVEFPKEDGEIYLPCMRSASGEESVKRAAIAAALQWIEADAPEAAA